MTLLCSCLLWFGTCVRIAPTLWNGCVTSYARCSAAPTPACQLSACAAIDSPGIAFRFACNLNCHVSNVVTSTVTCTVTKTQHAVLASRRRAIDQSDGEVEDADAMDEEDQYEEHEGDNEPEGQAASSGNHTEPSTLLDGPLSKQDEAKQEVQRQRNLEQALHIQMEMQKKLHEQLEVASLLFSCVIAFPCQLHSKTTAQPIRLDLWLKV